MVDDLREVLLVDAVELAGLRLVDQIEQRREGVAQIEAAAAAVADVEDPLELLLERGVVVELRVLPAERVARGRLETALAACLVGPSDTLRSPIKQRAPTGAR